MKRKIVSYVICAAAGITISGFHANLTTDAYQTAGTKVIAHAASQSGFENCNDTVYVTCDTLRYRSSASVSDGSIAGRVYRGESFKRVGKNGNWSVILVNGTKRYAASEFLSTSAPKKEAEKVSSGSQSTGGTQVGLESNYRYAEFSKINSGKAILYKSSSQNRKNKVVCVNAGHGTKGGERVKTQCHPDGTAKVTGGTTGAGATTAIAVSSGMTFSDGTPESKVTLAMAKILKERLLSQGYDVLMIRESDDVQLDNIARTVLANNRADCHIALHWDSTTSNKGCFFMSVPSQSSYRAMEPVASHWQEHNRLGESLVAGLKNAGNKIFSGGSMEMDLTQTSYSTIPSVDIELGDKSSSHSEETLNQLANGLVTGVNSFFGF